VVPLFRVIVGGGRKISQVGYNLEIKPSGEDGIGSCSSGDVVSAASSLIMCIPAAGDHFVPLRAGRLYTWRVIVRLSDGTVASVQQRFSTGLQSRHDWHPSAQFIGLPSSANRVPDGDAVLCPWLRGPDFHIAANELSAADSLLTVASIGWHEVYINGKRLEESAVLIPSVSDLHRRVLSHQYDVSTYLHEGQNKLAFWAAPGWSQLTWPTHNTLPSGTNFNVSTAPLVMAQLNVCNQTGCTVRVVTEGLSRVWRARPSILEHIGSWVIHMRPHHVLSPSH
jgi:alpha-L-rhamnosidase